MKIIVSGEFDKQNVVRYFWHVVRIPISFVALIAILGVDPGLAGTDPHSMGMGGARIMYGGGIESAVLNPALLGAQLEPWGGARLIPFCNSNSFGYWSDKLALKPYRKISSIGGDEKWQKLITDVVRSSFRVSDRSPEKTSKRITRRVKRGISIYNRAHVSLLGLTLGTMAVDIRTNVDIQVDLPGAPFLVFFSDTKGLKPGNNFSLKHLGAQGRVTTDISAAYGLPVDLSGLIDRLNSFTRGIADFKHASVGLGLTFSLGNGFLDLRTKSGELGYTGDGTSLFMDADMSIKTSGTGLSSVSFKTSDTGLRSDWKFENPYLDGFTLAGFGVGINAGVVLYGEHTTLGVALRQLGLMVWRDVKGSDQKIRTQDLTILDFYDDDFDLFDPEKNGSFPLENEILQNRKNKVEWMPTRLNIGVGYRFNFLHSENSRRRALSEYINTSLEYEQTLAPWPNHSFIPRIALGAENGFLWGVFPWRVGLIFGGVERVASTIGFDIGLRNFRFQCAYKAVGNMFWYPKRGFEIALGFSSEWRRYRDPDNDGISDKTDKCAFSEEDFDGFEDTDGCIDPDNDRDGIADTIDMCKNIPEDFDSFEDSDGCPDFDNDSDSIADTVDVCPMKAEDFDGFEDTDGCVDPDNDNDGIADTLDMCKNIPEDFDTFKDLDGCPDFDNDSDSIADSLDACPMQAEDFDGFEDTDGCPDSLDQIIPEQKEPVDSLGGILPSDIPFGNIAQCVLEKKVVFSVSRPVNGKIRKDS